jgi:hypothetical protein
MLPAMRQNRLIAATGICLALIAYATLIRLMGRPALLGHTEPYWAVVAERMSAYGMLGFSLSFLLPGLFALSCALAASVPILLELLLDLIAGRDPAFFDLFQKIAGGIIGVALAQATLAFLPRPPWRP